MPPDSLSVSAEALVAVSGILRDKPLTEVTAEAARNLPRAWSEKVTAFFTETEWRPFKVPKVPDYEETYDALAVGLSPEDKAKLLAEVRDQELGDAYSFQVDAARGYLLERWPINQRDTATGPRNEPPSTMQQGQAWSLFTVINDPNRILDEMLMGTLLEEQAEAFREVCPGLFDRLRGLIDMEIKERQAKSNDFAVAWDRERVLRTLMGLPQEVPITEKKRGGDAPPEASPAAEINIDFSRERPQVIENAQ